MIPAGITSADQLPVPGEIIVNKTAVPVNADPDNREFDITLTVEGNPLTSTDPADIVLVLDVSGSMAENLGDKTRLQSLKDAANYFINGALSAGMDNRISVVSYAGDIGSSGTARIDGGWRTYYNDTPYNDASIVQSFTSDASLLTTKVNSLKAEGGTNMQAGFMKAAEELANGREGVQKIVIFMTDGEPTFYYDAAYYRISSGNYAWSEGITFGPGNSFTAIGRDKAIAEAQKIKADYKARIFTVGLIADSQMNSNIESVLNPQGDNKYQEAYFPAANANELESVFGLSTEI